MVITPGAAEPLLAACAGVGALPCTMPNGAMSFSLAGGAAATVLWWLSACRVMTSCRCWRTADRFVTSGARAWM